MDPQQDVVFKPVTGGAKKSGSFKLLAGLLVLGLVALGWNYRSTILKGFANSKEGSTDKPEVPGEVMLKYDDAVSNLSEIREDYERALRRGMGTVELSQHLALYSRALIALHKQCKSITEQYSGSEVRKVQAMKERCAGEYDELISYCLDQGMKLAPGMPRQLE